MRWNENVKKHYRWATFWGQGLNGQIGVGNGGRDGWPMGTGAGACAPSALGLWPQGPVPRMPLLLTVSVGEPPPLRFPQGAVEGLGTEVSVSPDPAERLRTGPGVRDNATLAAPLASGAWGWRQPWLVSPRPPASSPPLMAIPAATAPPPCWSCQLESRCGWAASTCWIDL